MSETFRELMERHHGFYEVAPYYRVVDERARGTAATPRRIHAGFDVDVYGVKIAGEPHPSRDYESAFETLRELAEEVSRDATDLCSIDVIPFDSTIVLNAQSNFQHEAMLRIRIAHGRGIDQPAGAAEDQALRQVQEQLHRLGVSHGKGPL